LGRGRKREKGGNILHKRGRITSLAICSIGRDPDTKKECGLSFLKKGKKGGGANSSFRKSAKEARGGKKYFTPGERGRQERNRSSEVRAGGGPVSFLRRKRRRRDPCRALEGGTEPQRPREKKEGKTALRS